jgi:hypothetical protein
MCFARILCTIVLSYGLGACATHPLPEDVTGIKTTQIVHRIRCEAKEAVDRQKKRIIEEPSDSPWRARTRNTKLKILEQVGIVYSFSLNGQESNNLTSATATFQKTWSNGTFTFNPGLGDTLTRQNVRAFTVVDNFSELLKINERYCAQSTGPNYQYPIVGNIGIAEMIDTFVIMAPGLQQEQQGIENGGDSPSLAMNTAPAMVDTISFTTTLSAGVTPTWMLTPVTTALQLTSASIQLGVSRTDIHQVIIGLALPAPVSSLSPVTAPSSNPNLAQANRQRFGLLVTGYPSTRNGEAVALEAVNNQILRFEVPKSLIVTP